MDGVHSDKTDRRAMAVQALSLLRGEPQAIHLALQGLDDDNPGVRASAATALGGLHASFAIPKLKAALDDKSPSVVLAAANALVEMHVASAYSIYAEVLDGERKAGKGLVEDQLNTLKDKRKLARMGIEEGIGFIPYAGTAYSAVRTIFKDDGSQVRVNAAKMLEQSPNHAADNALADAAVSDKSEQVRLTALLAIAKRGHSSSIGKVAPALFDDKEQVRDIAAAVILHLRDVSRHSAEKKVATDRLVHTYPPQ